MIQSILFFLLGFLCAGFLALMVAPVVWRRAVNLTRKRVESSIPLTLSEIQAEKDAIRADFAMATRRLEQKLQSTSDKAARQATELGRRHEEMKALVADRDAGTEKIAALNANLATLGSKLEATQKELAQTVERLSSARARIDEQADELYKMNALYDDASFTASSRQIELVARESEVEKLSGDLAAARNSRKEAERKMRETMAENRQVHAEAEATRRKVAELERKMARMITSLTDAEERLERREKELARLRRQSRSSTAAKPQSPAEAGGEEAELEPIETRFELLERENRQLRRLVDESQEKGDDEALREQMHELAAEVVAMTARLEPDLQDRLQNEAAPVQDDRNGRPISLAERIRALQSRAEAG
ncbi:MAG: hypothetical protein ACXIVF_01400 [Rhizobiaceae bacterium]